MAVTVSTATVAGNRRGWQTATGIPSSCGDELLPHDSRRTVPRGESVQKRGRRLL